MSCSSCPSSTKEFSSCGGAYLCGTPACGQEWTALQKNTFESLIPKIRRALNEGGRVSLVSRSNPCAVVYFREGGVYQNSQNMRFHSFDELMCNLEKQFQRFFVDGIVICSPCEQIRLLKSDIIINDGCGDPNDDRCC